MSELEGWASYKFHNRFRPGGIIDVNEYLDVVSLGINRRFFQYDTLGKPAKPKYENVIVTGNEKLLTWQPYAFMLSFIGFVIAVAYAIFR